MVGYGGGGKFSEGAEVGGQQAHFAIWVKVIWILLKIRLHYESLLDGSEAAVGS